MTCSSAYLIINNFFKCSLKRINKNCGIASKLLRNSIIITSKSNFNHLSCNTTSHFKMQSEVNNKNNSSRKDMNPGTLKQKNQNNSGTSGGSTKLPILNKIDDTFLRDVVKSDSDQKQYKVFKLRNGLTACLISDPTKKSLDNDISSSGSSSSGSEESEVSEGESETSIVSSSSSAVAVQEDDEEKMAAAALTINVGSFSDPKKYPGMAHFLEHMVFMGSAKYPEENDFDSFLSKRGGSDNASTDCEVTTFYFECLEKHLYKALDKFAQFFISPLMKREAMTREREAIESEFQMALPSDVNCKDQLLASLSKKDCPVNSFGWGNLITLRDNVDDDELYKAVHEFRKRHYSAHRMTLAVQSQMPLQTLQDYVVECFSDIPTNDLPPDNFSEFQNVFDTPEFQRIYYVKPINNVRQVELRWALPSLLDKYKSKPHQYISWILGDEGKGSLLSYLRKRVWVLGLSAGVGDSGFELNSMYSLFSVTMTLTTEGLQHLREVIEALFSYLKMLNDKGPNKRIYDEIKQIEDASFKFQEETPAVEWVEDLSECMVYFPPEHYISGSRLIFEYNPEDIQSVLSQLQPSKVNIMILCDNPDIKYDKIEKWFNTYYTDSEIPKDWLDSWEKVKTSSEFSLPAPNIFISTNFNILPETTNYDYPQKILNSDKGELWYRQDQKFKLPIAYYNFNLINPDFLTSPRNVVLKDFFVHLFYLAVAEEAYPAQLAELSYTFRSNDVGIIMRFSGFNEKLPNLLQLICEHLAKFNTLITQTMFEAIKDKLFKNYNNSLLKPSTLAKDLRMKIMVGDYFSITEKYDVISSIQLQDVQWFSDNFFKKLYVKGLIQGNISNTQATQIFNEFIAKINFQPIAKDTYPKFAVIQLPNGESQCRVKSFNVNDPNSIVTNYYQSGPYDLEGSVIIELILLVIQEPLFDTLRTKEQLGYHVYCTVRETYGILGYTITVNAQTKKYSTSYIDERIEAFIQHATELLEALTETQFNRIKKNLIKIKNVTDVHLREEVSRNWGEIIENEYQFDRLKKEMAAIEKLKINDVKEWWKKHNCCDTPNFKKLSIQVEGFDTNNVTKDNQDSTAKSKDPSLSQFQIIKDNKVQQRKNIYLVDNVDSYKANLPFYPKK